MTRPVLGVAALSLVGALVSLLAFPPYGIGLLIVPGVALFLTAIRLAGTPRRGVLAGAVYGLVFFGFLFPWIAELGMIAFVPLWLVQALFFVVYAALLARASAWSDWTWFVAAVGGWGAMEWLREHVPLGGFPWGMVGYPLGEYAPVRGAAQWIGGSGWSVIGVGLAAALVIAARSQVRNGHLSWAGDPRAFVLTFIALGGLLLGGVFSPGVANGRLVRVAIVQGSTPCPGTHCADERVQTYLRHLDLTHRIAADSVDLVVWPEGSMGGFTADPVNNPTVDEAVSAEAERLGAAIIAGSDRPIDDERWVNVALLYGPDGTYLGEYMKQHPVPFGEYVPARPLFGWIDELGAVPRDMVRGQGPVIFTLPFGRIGSVISFESSFSRYSRAAAGAGAQVLIVATSQVSYPLSAASDQLIGITRMRAAETGLDVVHAALTGRSTLITAGGRLGRLTEKTQPDVVIGTVRVRDAGPTVYVRFGDWLQTLSATTLAAVLLWRRSHAHRE